MAQLLYSIKDVFGSYLKDGQKFHIPEYQRGYKWNSQQIEQLLSDIHEFETSGDEALFYCLQNITIIEKERSSDLVNVIDGQQRLTTISLLLTYLEEGERVKEKLIYSVRDSSNEFLQALITYPDVQKSLLASTGFQEFIDSFAGTDYDYQDIYFMYNAYRTFDSWFRNNEAVSRIAFKEKLLDHVKLIVNRVEGVNEQELFMNLNTGRVHLDGSDLVRAILITRVAKQEMEEYGPDNLEDVIRLNERRVRIGWELDELNTWWSKPDVRAYFSKFTNIQTAPKETIQFNEQKNPINLLYKIWAESKGHKDVRLSWFEAKNSTALELYASIIRVHRTLEDWYADRKMYHFLGFLFNHGKPKFKFYWRLWNARNQTRPKFIELLKNQINKSIFGESGEKEKSDIEEFLFRMICGDSSAPVNWYEDGKLERILILLDVIAHSEDSESGNPFPFLKPKFFVNHKEDIEHIYPGTPKQLSELQSLDSPMESINQYINKLNNGFRDGQIIENWLESEAEWKEMEILQQEERIQSLKNEIYQKRPINSIGNLVLLHKSINRGFGNDYYINKRSIVVNNTRNGLYVRNHTLDVFVKNIEADDLQEWNMEDIRKNAQNIHDRLTGFFNIDLTKKSNEKN